MAWQTAAASQDHQHKLINLRLNSQYIGYVTRTKVLLALQHIYKQRFYNLVYVLVKLTRPLFT